MGFGNIKIDPLDKIYSEIIRFGLERCQRCQKPNQLQCAHIMGRAHKNTRWMLTPHRNAVALCMNCHSWFDGCKDNTPIFSTVTRIYTKATDNAYAFLVYQCGYSWESLQQLYALAHRPGRKIYPIEKIEIRSQLKKILDGLKK